MNPPDLAAIDAELEQLLALAPAARAERLRALESRAPDRAALMRRLLAVAERAETGPVRVAFSGDGPPEAPPAIPGYRIERELGRGGMATVYEATREVLGVAQSVAIKLLHPVIADPQARERFVREQQILASLVHPNIARLLDAGTVDGRAWMAMEHVDGEPIDRVFEATAAGVGAIVAAVARLADAVQAAHERLVVHRDIKPGNVLVDASGAPRLIDFGIAKVLEAGAVPAAQATGTGAAPMTLRYASPEQLRGEPVGVGSDIYQLGLLLFRLLTGAWPYSEDEAQLPLARTRAEAPPRRPSECAPDAALARRLRGDLDSIVLRCLATRPEQRYRTADELRRDLEAHLQARPVAARRHTRRYLLSTFVRRNRLGLALAAALLVYAGTVTWQSAELRRERNAAEAARARAESTHSFLLEVVGSADPQDPDNRGRDLDELLRSGIARVEQDFAGQPLLSAQMLTDLGTVLMRRGRFDEAEPPLRRAVVLRRLEQGNQHRDTLAATLPLVECLIELDRRDEALAESDRLRAAVEARFGAASLPRIEVDVQRGLLVSLLGRHADAEADLRRALDVEAELGPDPEPALSGASREELRADLMVALGNALMRERRFDDAEAFVRDAFVLRRELYGDDDPRTLDAQQNLGFLLRFLKQPEAAEAQFREVLARQRALYGGAHRRIAYTIGHIANLHTDRGDYDGAVAVWREVEAEARAAMGPDHPWIAITRLAQATSLFHGGRHDEARRILDELDAIEGREDDLGERVAALRARIAAAP